MFDNSCVCFLYMYRNQLWTYLNISYTNVLGFAFGIISYSRFNRAPTADEDMLRGYVAHNIIFKQTLQTNMQLYIIHIFATSFLSHIIIFIYIIYNLYGALM